MPGLESALLAQMIQKLALVLREVHERKSRRQFDHASRILGDAWKTVFGLDRRFLQMMHAHQVPAVLGNPQRIRGLVHLVAEEADLLKLQGDAESAAATAKWAVQIVESAKLPQDDLEMRTLMSRLRALSAT